MSVEPQAGPAELLLGSRGSESVSHQAKVVLEEVSYEDQVEYFCEVENIIATSRSEPVSLTVHCPPRVNSDNNKHLFIEWRDLLWFSSVRSLTLPSARPALSPSRNYF